jgi:hypothetical protein
VFDEERKMSAHKKIGYVTSGFQQLPVGEQQLAIDEFQAISKEKNDWIYSLLEGDVFAQLNEQGSYTIMLYEEY